MTVTFGYLETRNNWWWAIDNLVVAASPAPLFSEDFESIVLNHLHIESRVFLSHAIGLCTTVVAASTLGSTFGLRGLLCGSVVGSCAMAASLYFGAQRGLARLQVESRRN